MQRVGEHPRVGMLFERGKRELEMCEGGLRLNQPHVSLSDPVVHNGLAMPAHGALSQETESSLDYLPELRRRREVFKFNFRRQGRGVGCGQEKRQRSVRSFGNQGQAPLGRTGVTVFDSMDRRTGQLVAAQLGEAQPAFEAGLTNRPGA